MTISSPTIFLYMPCFARYRAFIDEVVHKKESRQPFVAILKVESAKSPYLAPHRSFCSLVTQVGTRRLPNVRPAD